MSILGVIVRLRPADVPVIVARAGSIPGVDVSLNPGDGRLVLVIEDAESGAVDHPAAASLAAISQWPEVLNTSLVYEYSGPDAPPSGDAALTDYRDWRGDLAPKPACETRPRASRVARMENPQ